MWSVFREVFKGYHVVERSETEDKHKPERDRRASPAPFKISGKLVSLVTRATNATIEWPSIPMVKSFERRTASVACRSFREVHAKEAVSLLLVAAAVVRVI